MHLPPASTHHQGYARFVRLVWVGCLSLLMLIGGLQVSCAPAFASSYNKEILVNADFSGRDLTNDSFTKADLRNSNFSQSDLTGVSFFAANLEEANLEGANLSFATLDSARFARANLTNAILTGAFAYSAEFRKATIDGADFTDVDLRNDTHDILCSVAQGVNPVTGRNTRDTLNCE